MEVRKTEDGRLVIGPEHLIGGQHPSDKAILSDEGLCLLAEFLGKELEALVSFTEAARPVAAVYEEGKGHLINMLIFPLAKDEERAYRVVLNPSPQDRPAKV